MFTVNHGVTSSVLCSSFHKQIDAENYARNLSKTVNYTVELRNDGKTVAFFSRGDRFGIDHSGWIC